MLASNVNSLSLDKIQYQNTIAQRYINTILTHHSAGEYKEAIWKTKELLLLTKSWRNTSLTSDATTLLRKAETALLYEILSAYLTAVQISALEEGSDLDNPLLIGAFKIVGHILTPLLNTAIYPDLVELFHNKFFSIIEIHWKIISSLLNSGKRLLIPDEKRAIYNFYKALSSFNITYSHQLTSLKNGQNYTAFINFLESKLPLDSLESDNNTNLVDNWLTMLTQRQETLDNYRQQYLNSNKTLKSAKIYEHDITNQVNKILNALVKMLGEPPCKFSVMITEPSLIRGQFGVLILIDNNTAQQNPYFQSLSKLFINYFLGYCTPLEWKAGTPQSLGLRLIQENVTTIVNTVTPDELAEKTVEVLKSENVSDQWLTAFSLLNPKAVYGHEDPTISYFFRLNDLLNKDHELPKILKKALLKAHPQKLQAVLKNISAFNQENVLCRDILNLFLETMTHWNCLVQLNTHQSVLMHDEASIESSFDDEINEEFANGWWKAIAQLEFICKEYEKKLGHAQITLKALSLEHNTLVQDIILTFLVPFYQCLNLQKLGTTYSPWKDYIKSLLAPPTFQENNNSLSNPTSFEELSRCLVLLFANICNYKGENVILKLRNEAFLNPYISQKLCWTVMEQLEKVTRRHPDDKFIDERIFDRNILQLIYGLTIAGVSLHEKHVDDGKSVLERAVRGYSKKNGHQDNNNNTNITVGPNIYLALELLTSCDAARNAFYPINAFDLIVQYETDPKLGAKVTKAINNLCLHHPAVDWKRQMKLILQFKLSEESDSATHETKEQIELTSMDGQIHYFHPQILTEISDENGELAPRYLHVNDRIFYIEPSPTQPLQPLLAELFTARLFPNGLISCPHTELFKYKKVGANTYHVLSITLLPAAPSGSQLLKSLEPNSENSSILFNNDVVDSSQVLDRLDESYAAWIIFTMLFNGDGTIPEHLFVNRYKGAETVRFSIVGWIKSSLLANPIKRENDMVRLGKELWSLLLCLPNIDKAPSTALVAQLTGIDPYTFLNKLLFEMNELNNSVGNFFSKVANFSTNFSLEKNAIYELYGRFTRLSRLLQKETVPTLRSMIYELNLPVMLLFLENRLNHKNVFENFMAISAVKPALPNRPLEIMHSNMPQNVESSGQPVLASLQRDLDKADSEHKLFTTMFDDLKKGMLDKLSHFSSECQTQIINKITSWSDFGLKVQNDLLQYIVEEKLAFETLILINCEVLTDEILIQILKNSPNLCNLRLDGCSNLTKNLWNILETHCKGLLILDLWNLHQLTSLISENQNELSSLRYNLEKLTISTCTNLRDINLAELPNLKYIEVNNQAILKTLILIAPALQAVILTQCANLSTVTTEADLRTLKIAGCPALGLGRIKKIAHSTIHLHDVNIESSTEISPLISQHPFLLSDTYSLEKLTLRLNELLGSTTSKELSEDQLQLFNTLLQQEISLQILYPMLETSLGDLNANIRQIAIKILAKLNDYPVFTNQQSSIQSKQSEFLMILTHLFVDETDPMVRQEAVLALKPFLNPHYQDKVFDIVINILNNENLHVYEVHALQHVVQYYSEHPHQRQMELIEKVFSLITIQDGNEKRPTQYQLRILLSILANRSSTYYAAIHQNMLNLLNSDSSDIQISAIKAIRDSDIHSMEIAKNLLVKIQTSPGEIAKNASVALPHVLNTLHKQNPFSNIPDLLRMTLTALVEGGPEVVEETQIYAVNILGYFLKITGKISIAVELFEIYKKSSTTDFKCAIIKAISNLQENINLTFFKTLFEALNSFIETKDPNSAGYFIVIDAFFDTIHSLAQFIVQEKRDDTEILYLRTAINEFISKHPFPNKILEKMVGTLTTLASQPTSTEGFINLYLLLTNSKLNVFLRCETAKALANLATKHCALFNEFIDLSKSTWSFANLPEDVQLTLIKETSKVIIEAPELTDTKILIVKLLLSILSPKNKLSSSVREEAIFCLGQIAEHSFNLISNLLNASNLESSLIQLTPKGLISFKTKKIRIVLLDLLSQGMMHKEPSFKLAYLYAFKNLTRAINLSNKERANFIKKLISMLEDSHQDWKLTREILNILGILSNTNELREQLKKGLSNLLNETASAHIEYGIEITASLIKLGLVTEEMLGYLIKGLDSPKVKVVSNSSSTEVIAKTDSQADIIIEPLLHMSNDSKQRFILLDLIKRLSEPKSIYKEKAFTLLERIIDQCNELFVLISKLLSSTSIQNSSANIGAEAVSDAVKISAHIVNAIYQSLAQKNLDDGLSQNTTAETESSTHDTSPKPWRKQQQSSWGKAANWFQAAPEPQVEISESNMIEYVNLVKSTWALSQTDGMREKLITENSSIETWLKELDDQYKVCSSENLPNIIASDLINNCGIFQQLFDAMQTAISAQDLGYS